jgi:hypothetical protein
LGSLGHGNTRAAEIISELGTGRDATTGQQFRVGPGGQLASAPTRRVALLDELARLDPKAAAEWARRILEGDFTSPDEWAVCLRNYAKESTTLESRAFLEGRLKTMLQYEPWQANPSAGFLEAYDVAVYLGGTNLLPTLTGFIRLTDDRPLAHAAYLAIDRLVINEPVPIFTHLMNDPGAMAGREVTRANYFARADVSDSAQKDLLEKYLLSPNLGAAELRTFAGLFPNVNLMVSHNLLTHTEPPTGDAIRRLDRASLEVIEGWLGEPRFQRVAPSLQRAKARLAQFAK